MPAFRFPPSEGLIYVPVVVRGPDGKEVRLPFVLDTGTERTIVDVGVAEKLGFLPQHVVQASRVSSPLGAEEGCVVRTPCLHALGWERDDFKIACHRLSANATVAGLLGADF